MFVHKQQIHFPIHDCLLLQRERERERVIRVGGWVGGAICHHFSVDTMSGVTVSTPFVGFHPFFIGNEGP